MEDHPSTSAVTKSTVILDKSSDWDDWLYIVTSIARDADILDLAGLGGPVINAPSVQAPREPVYTDFKADAGSIGELDAAQLDLFKFVYDQYKVKLHSHDRAKDEQKRDHEKRQKALKELGKHIRNTVSRRTLAFLHKDTTPSEMMATLRLRLVPTDRARELELIRAYQEIKKALKTQQIKAWMDLWEKTYARMKDLDVPDVSKDRPLFDFLQVIKGNYTNWAENYELMLNQMIKKKEELPTIYELLSDFRIYLRANRATEKVSSSSSFATLNGEPQGEPQGKPHGKSVEGPKRSKPCICKALHRWSECPYLMEGLRNKGWKPKPEIEAEIEKRKQNDQWFREVISKIQLKAAEAAKTLQNSKKDEKSRPTPNSDDDSPHGAFAVEQKAYKLQNCWTLDSATCYPKPPTFDRIDRCRSCNFVRRAGTHLDTLCVPEDFFFRYSQEFFTALTTERESFSMYRIENRHATAMEL